MLMMKILVTYGRNVSNLTPLVTFMFNRVIYLKGISYASQRPHYESSLFEIYTLVDLLLMQVMIRLSRQLRIAFIGLVCGEI